MIFSIADTGSGISPEVQETIFEPFIQGSMGAQAGGTGLGLPISRSLAQAHGGDVWVGSTTGDGQQVGAVFFFRLPVKGKQ